MKRYFSPMPEPRAASLGLLILRLALGGFMLTHGWPKLQMILSGNTAGFPDPIGLGSELSLYLVTFAEVVCAVLIILGLVTRLAAIPLMIDMGVAITVAHAGQPFDAWEKAALFLAGFTTLLLSGAGLYSLDALWAHDADDETRSTRKRKAPARAEAAPAPVVVRAERVEVIEDRDRRDNRDDRSERAASATDTTVREVHQNRDEDGRFIKGHHDETHKTDSKASGKSSSSSRSRSQRSAKDTGSDKTAPRNSGGSSNSRRKQSS